MDNIWSIFGQFTGNFLAIFDQFLTIFWATSYHFSTNFGKLMLNKAKNVWIFNLKNEYNRNGLFIRKGCKWTKNGPDVQKLFAPPTQKVQVQVKKRLTNFSTIKGQQRFATLAQPLCREKHVEPSRPRCVKLLASGKGTNRSCNDKLKAVISSLC